MKRIEPIAALLSPGSSASARCAVLMLALILVLLVTAAHAQNSQFLFDADGNLQVQMAEITGLPQIFRQPQNQIVSPDEAAAFSVLAANPTGLTYQWRFNATNTVGASSDTLLLTNVSVTNEGQYTVVLSNSFGSVTSSPAALFLDSDHDGLPDSWELAYFGNLNQTATGDSDGDGNSNLTEFGDGTNPTNSVSVLFRLTVSNDGGTVDVSPFKLTYTNGEIVTLTATPFIPDTFHAWTGDVTTRTNPLTITMSSNRTLVAHFKPMDFMWVNSATGDWNGASNWNWNLTPATNDNVIIANGSSVIVKVTNSVECASFTLGNSSVAPTLTGAGTLVIHGNSTWTGGTMSGSGRTVIDSSATLTINNPSAIYLTSHTLENAGTILWNGASAIGFTTAVITNRSGAVFEAQNSIDFGYTGGGRFDNTGTFRKSTSGGTTTFDSGVSFNNYGSVEIQAGTLLFNNTLVNNGLISLSSGTTNRILGGGSGSGVWTNPATALVAWTANTFTLNIGAQLKGSGLYNITGSGIVVCNADLAIENLNLANQLSGSGIITVNNVMNWSAGTMDGAGRTVISSTATMNSPGGVTLDTRTLENAGTVLWTGGNFFLAGAAITNRPGAVFEVQNAPSLILPSSASASRLDNAGTFRKSASGTALIGTFVNLNNYGVVEIQGGTLSLNGGGTSSGAISVATGTTLNFSGGTFASTAASSITGPGNLNFSLGTANLAGLVNVSGTQTFANFCTANLTGNYTCTNNTVTISTSGTANFGGTGVVAPNTLTINSGTLGGSNTVTVGSLMNWPAGTMTGSGRTIIGPGATLNIPDTVTLDTRTLENAGTMVWSGGPIFMSSSVISNRAGALLDAQNTASLAWPSGSSPRVDNAGTFRKSIGGTSSLGTVSLNNYNTVQVLGGKLDLHGGGLNNGTMDVSAGNTLELSFGTFTSSAASSITGAGTLSFSGGTVTLAGLVNVTGPNTFNAASGGTLNLTGNYICTNNTLTVASSSDANFNGTGTISPAVLSVSGGSSANFNGTNTITPAVVNLTGGTFGGSNLVTVLNQMTWSGGDLSRSGNARTIISPAATLTINNGGEVHLYGCTLDNAGTASWTGANLGMGTAVITNRPGALFQLQSSAAIFQVFGFNRFDNGGTVRKLGTSTTTIGSNIPLTNYGTVDIRGGILGASGGFTPASNSLLNCALGGINVATGYGRLQVSGTVTLNGRLSVDLLPGFTPVTNDTFTVLTTGTRSGAFSSFSYPSSRVAMSLSNSPTSVVLRTTDVFPIPQPVLMTPQVVGSNALLTWTATSNVTYRLENNPDVSSTNWIPIPGDVTTLSNTANKLDALTTSNQFYRVRVLP